MLTSTALGYSLSAASNCSTCSNIAEFINGAVEHWDFQIGDITTGNTISTRNYPNTITEDSVVDPSSAICNTFPNPCGNLSNLGTWTLAGSTPPPSPRISWNGTDITGTTQLPNRSRAVKDIFSALPQVADIDRSVFHLWRRPLVLQITAFWVRAIPG
jgi:hypothetical protein